jgi:elongation factor G
LGEVNPLNSPSTDRIRNVAFVGHSGSGKTSVAEALLYRAGVIPRAGSTDDGSTVCDTEPEETKRKMSLSLAVAPFDWKAKDPATGETATYKVNVLDTPGYGDFAGEVDAALAVADLAVIVVSAVDGVEVGTEWAWRRCQALGLPRIVFVNKEDKQRADFHAVLSSLRAHFGSGFVPLELPLGEEEQLHGIADVLSDEGLEYDADGTHHSEPLPADVADEEHRLHDEIVEEIVAGDDEQLERYLSGDVPTADELERTLAHEVLECVEFPVLLGSAATGVGIDRLADFICELGPSPLDRPATVIGGTERVPVPADAAAASVAYVFKTVADQFVGQVSLFKVLSGTIRGDDRLVNSHTSAEERLHGLFHLRGKEHVSVNSVVAGDIAAVAKLSATPTHSTLAAKGSPVRVEPPVTPPPAYSLALEPVTQSDDDKLSDALARLCSEDPTLSVVRPEESHQTVLCGAGDTHLAVALERLGRKFGVNVTTTERQVPYRETITAPADAEGKVKKQSGGHGQYAVVNLRVAPTERGAGSAFVDKIVGGAIPRNFLPAVQKGVEETMVTGGAFGFPVVDVQVECYDGKYHSVDSSDMAFRTAASHGLKEALAKATPVVLEPISLLTVTVPDTHQGDVLGDINARRGRVNGSNPLGDGLQEITAMVPAAEIQRYAVDLRSMTGGRGSFVAVHDHYDVLPSHLATKLVAEREKAKAS